MKKLFKLLFVLVLSLSVLSFKTVNTNAKEYYEIVSHKVDVDVNKNGSLFITEEIKVHFSAQRQGIYVNLPVEYFMSWDNEQPQKYNFPIKDIKILSDHHYSIESYDTFKRIILGDENKYANEYETYRFSYTIYTRDLGFEDGRQMLYLNIITNGWSTTTDNVDFTISLPQGIDSKRVFVSTPANNILQGSGELDGLTLKILGNTIRGSYHQQMSQSETITIQVLLPNDYFAFPDLQKHGAIGAIVGVIFTVILFVIFWIFGKDEPLIRTVEFHVPNGMNSAEVGTIIDEQVDNRDVMSLILDWGRRGLITIIEEKDNLIITKLKEIEYNVPNYERTLFEGLFKEKDIVNSKDLKYSFYVIINQTKKELTAYFNQGDHRLSTEISVVLQYVFTVLGCVPICALTYFAYAGYYYDGVGAFFISLIIGFFIILGNNIFVSLYNGRYYFKRIHLVLLSILTTIFFVVPFIIFLFFLKEIRLNLIYGVIAIFMQIVTLFLIVYMRKRTAYGNEMLGKILGLREFIAVAEEDRLKVLLEENPYYLYDILPYAYALGLSDCWVEHFKDLAVEPCEWFDTYYPYGNFYSRLHGLETSMSRLQHDMNAQPVDVGGGSSSGGDFSGGGGFGGSSGGSW